jgi:hypothetical protein
MRAAQHPYLDPARLVVHQSLATMQLITVVCALLASTASARVFTLYSDINYWGDSHIETQPDNGNCCTLTKVQLEA